MTPTRPRLYPARVTPLNLPFDPIARAELTWRERWGDGAPATQMATATSLLRVAQVLTMQFDQACARHGLTFARYEALVLLAFARASGLPMTRIGERLMVHPTSATSIVQRLETQGFVRRVPNPDDGRGTLAQITDAGHAVMEAATADLHALGFGLDVLDQGEHEQLFGVLRRVRVAAGDFADADDPAEAADTAVAEPERAGH